MIDVIIPAYNAHKTIEQTLCSIAYQEIADEINVYIVNDFSDKDYSEFVNSFKNFIKIKELKLSKNSGPGVARQYGIDNSNSEFIVFIDADDVFSDCYSIKKLYDKIVQDNCDIVIGNFMQELHDGFNEYNSDTIWLHGKMYRRSFLEENNVRFNDSRANEDNGFNQLAILCNANISYLDDKVYIWRYNEDSITRCNNREYEYKGLIGYAYNMCYALEKSLERNCDLYKFSSLAFSVIVSSYHYYLQYYEHKKIMDEMLKYTYKILMLYQKYPLSEDDELNIIEQQYNFSINENNRKNLLKPKISFDKFMKKLERMGA